MTFNDFLLAISAIFNIYIPPNKRVYIRGEVDKNNDDIITLDSFRYWYQSCIFNYYLVRDKTAGNKTLCTV